MAERTDDRIRTQREARVLPRITLVERAGLTESSVRAIGSGGATLAWSRHIHAPRHWRTLARTTHGVPMRR